MKKIIIAALLIAGIATTGFSQERSDRSKGKDGQRRERVSQRIQNPEERARLATDKLEKELSLTEKQKSEVYKINLDRAKKVSKSHELAQKQREDQRKKMQNEFVSSEKKLNNILNSEQRNKYASLKESRSKKFNDHKGQFKKGEKNVRRDTSGRGRASIKKSK